MAQFICHGLPINFTTGDSLQFLANWKLGAIDFLYLDSYDFVLDNNWAEAQKSQQHQLNEIELAWDKLSDRAIILLDDVDFLSGGKSRLSEAFLRNKNAINVMRAQQSLWLKGY
jgi:Fe-S cluster biosynthesis and repair protein YggX